MKIHFWCQNGWFWKPKWCNFEEMQANWSGNGSILFAEVLWKIFPSCTRCFPGWVSKSAPEKFSGPFPVANPEMALSLPMLFSNMFSGPFPLMRKIFRRFPIHFFAWKRIFRCFPVLLEASAQVGDCQLRCSMVCCAGRDQNWGRRVEFRGFTD